MARGKGPTGRGDNEAPKYLKELFHRLSDTFGTTSHVKQKQVDRSPPLKQN